MKTLKLFLILFGTALLSIHLSSCLDNDDYYSLNEYRVSTLTINPSGDTYYFTMDNGKTLWPAASYYPGFKPAKEQRALVNYTLLSDSLQGFDHYIRVNKIDTFLTKPIAENLGMQNDSVYGKDLVDIHDIWIGDGYLNVYFGTLWGGREAHFLNLIENKEGNSPYELEFRHNAFADPAVNYGRSLVAFNLSSLPDTEGKTVEIKVTVNTYNGKEIFKINHNSNGKVSSSPGNIEDILAESFINIEYIN